MVILVGEGYFFYSARAAFVDSGIDICLNFGIFLRGLNRGERRTLCFSLTVLLMQ